MLSRTWNTVISRLPINFDIFLFYLTLLPQFRSWFHNILQNWQNYIFIVWVAMEEVEGFGSWSFWDTSLWKQGNIASLGQHWTDLLKLWKKEGWKGLQEMFNSSSSGLYYSFSCIYLNHNSVILENVQIWLFHCSQRPFMAAPTRKVKKAHCKNGSKDKLSNLGFYLRLLVNSGHFICYILGIFSIIIVFFIAPSNKEDTAWATMLCFCGFVPAEDLACLFL